MSLEDFRAVVTKVCGQSKFTAHEIRQVFNIHSIQTKPAPGNQVQGEPYIPLRTFKDKFLPSLGWKKDQVFTAPKVGDAASVATS